MEHLSFASYLAKNSKMNKTWPTCIGSSPSGGTQTGIIHIVKYIQCTGVSQSGNHSLYAAVGAQVCDPQVSKKRRQVFWALQDNSKSSLRGSGAENSWSTLEIPHVQRPGDWEAQVPFVDQKVSCWAPRKRM